MFIMGGIIRADYIQYPHLLALAGWFYMMVQLLFLQ